MKLPTTHDCFRWCVYFILAITTASDGLANEFKPARKVSYNRDVRPLLADRCFQCHGPDAAKRQADLRLDEEQYATEWAIVPRDPENSELIARITADDPEFAMPPQGSHKQRLNAEEINLLKQWIRSGAEYAPHWSFTKPLRPTLPAVSSSHQCNSPIDYFVLTELERRNLEQSARADKHTLIRRLTLDLTGLPPTPNEIEDFVNDASENAWEKVIDRLLQSPRYGEHLARYWLDSARYADSNGYQYDFQRDQWVWRDWVINAFNSNMPFDQFTIEQIAGDLLPNATDQQILATGFHRNHPITVEGGVIDEEYRVEYVIDRAVTTSTVWLGLTMGCARCHDHKYDPLSQRDFYRFYSFFNQIEEKGFQGFAPKRRIASPLLEQGTTKVELPETMVMHELANPRETHVLERGEYDQHGEPVEARTPSALLAMPKHFPQNRLGLAKWLAMPDNPLVARVIVNRFWQQLFGTGLVRTAEDFGVQGEWPSHPELLDWLAVQFVESGWDVKALFKTIAMSAAYQQSSSINPSLQAVDPENRLLARGPTFRLDAESIRDSALFASGLLVERLGGPSVFPYHPKGLWMEMNNRPGFSSEYVEGSGDLLFRRSLYTFYKRTVTAPSMAAFDAPSREYCVVRRERTNTPLQALVMLHDPQFVEAAVALAATMLEHNSDLHDKAIAHGFVRCMSRQPTAAEARILLEVFAREQARFSHDKKAAKQMFAVGKSSMKVVTNLTDHAAMASVARILLNLSEFITKG